MARLLPLLAFLPLPLVLVRAGYEGAMPGSLMGEGWGRLFVAGQLARWVRGEAPWGVADLCFGAEPLPFWPVDLVPTAVLAATRPLGDAGAMAATIAVLFALAGAGTFAAARALGATTAGAIAAGLGLQAHPFLLRNAEDDILEVLAVGFVPLGIAALARALRAPSAGNLVLLGLAAWALGASNPYAALHAAIAGVVASPFLLKRHGARTFGATVAAMALGMGLAAAPVVATERRAGGRLGGAYTAGFTLAPGERVRLAPPGPRVAGEAPGEGGRAPRERPEPERKAPPPWATLPGGTAAIVGTAAALFSRRARPFAVVAVLAWLAGPAPGQLARMLHLGPGFRFDLVQTVVGALPLSLGNPQRGILIFAVAAWLAVARLGGWGLALAGLAIAEAATSLPDLRIPGAVISVDRDVLAAVRGPAITFPNGDPPVFHPGVPPKWGLYLASLHEEPVASDYARGGAPADLGFVAELSAVAGVPVSARLRDAPPSDTAGFASVLVLYSLLPPPVQARARDWLAAELGEPAVETEWGAVWRLD
ncbi:MAG: hypothetical protein ACOZNI_30040 [Myxococcota bacterium]